MRNITFDESTVLREYARIVGEKELVKQASDPIEQAFQNILSLIGDQDRRGMIAAETEFFKNFSTNPKYKEYTDKLKMVMNDPTQVESLKRPSSIEQDFQKIVSLKTSTREGRGALADFFKKYEKDPQYAQYSAKLKEVQEQQREEDLAKSVQKGAAQKTDGTIETQAADKSTSKVYDVSGETGENLVDSAHPGNMHTEVSHSKTDETLVETIVEQQEKDIAVVKKMPKGTYAKLVNLYNALHKEGKTEVLDTLMGIIKEIATPEDVIMHTLTTLANTLDEKGFVKAANEVDALIKKADDGDMIEQLRRGLLADIEDKIETSIWNPNIRSWKRRLAEEIQGVQSTDIYDAIQKVTGILNKWSTYLPGIEAIVNRLDTTVKDVISRKDSEPKQQTIEPSEEGTIVGRPGKGTPAKKNVWKEDKKVISIQNSINKLLSIHSATVAELKNVPHLGRDGRYGQNTADTLFYLLRYKPELAKAVQAATGTSLQYLYDWKKVYRDPTTINNLDQVLKTLISTPEQHDSPVLHETPKQIIDDRWNAAAKQVAEQRAGMKSLPQGPITEQQLIDAVKAFRNINDPAYVKQVIQQNNGDLDKARKVFNL